VVVEGMVERVGHDDTWYEQQGAGVRKYLEKSPAVQTAWIRVARRWKGEAETVIKVNADEGMCSFFFEVGKTYLVYAKGGQFAELQAHLCSGTKPIEIAQDDLAFLQTIAPPQLHEADVQAETSLLSYRMGERISVTLKNQNAMAVWLLTSCGEPDLVALHEDGREELHGAHPTKDCLAPPDELLSGSTRTYNVHLEDVYEHTHFKIMPGRYRFMFLYAINKSDPTLVGAGQRITMRAYSNVFLLE